MDAMGAVDGDHSDDELFDPEALRAAGFGAEVTGIAAPVQVVDVSAETAQLEFFFQQVVRRSLLIRETDSRRAYLNEIVRQVAGLTAKVSEIVDPLLSKK